MRKIIAALFILLSVFSYSQWSNTFSEAETVEQESSSSSAPEPKQEQYIQTEAAPAATNDCTVIYNGVEANDCDCDGIADMAETNEDEICGPPNPADPVPVDDYIPLLLIIAAVLITYKTYGRKSLS